MESKTLNQSLFDRLINENSREKASIILGVSIPTLQRWISSNSCPKYAQIILEHLETIRLLNCNLDFERMEKASIKTVVKNFIDSSSALKSLLSE